MRHRMMLLVVIVAGLIWSFRTATHPQPLFTMKDSPAHGADRLGSAFDVAQTGNLTGYVEWYGAIPEADPFAPRHSFYTPKQLPKKANPNLPTVKNYRLQHAVVYLRGINPERARPWPHAPVSVEWRDYDMRIRQGTRLGRLGFVKQGDTVTLISHEPVLHSIHANGASFFTQSLAKPGFPIERRFLEQGAVELSSGLVYVWARAHLFVCEHPYYTLTDERGQFTFSDVPAGDYELVVWHPNWHIANRERDPELLVDCRVTYHRPVERVSAVRVHIGQTTTIAPVTLDSTLFAR